MSTKPCTHIPEWKDQLIFNNKGEWSHKAVVVAGSLASFAGVFGYAGYNVYKQSGRDLKQAFEVIATGIKGLPDQFRSKNPAVIICTLIVGLAVLGLAYVGIRAIFDKKLKPAEEIERRKNQLGELEAQFKSINSKNTTLQERINVLQKKIDDEKEK